MTNCKTHLLGTINGKRWTRPGKKPVWCGVGQPHGSWEQCWCKTPHGWCPVGRACGRAGQKSEKVTLALAFWLRTRPALLLLTCPWRYYYLDRPKCKCNVLSIIRWLSIAHRIEPELLTIEQSLLGNELLVRIPATSCLTWASCMDPPSFQLPPWARDYWTCSVVPSSVYSL